MCLAATGKLSAHRDVLSMGSHDADNQFWIFGTVRESQAPDRVQWIPTCCSARYGCLSKTTQAGQVQVFSLLRDELLKETKESFFACWLFAEAIPTSSMSSLGNAVRLIPIPMENRALLSRRAKKKALTSSNLLCCISVSVKHMVVSIPHFPQPH